MNQNQIGRTVFDIDEESGAFYFQKAIEYHEWLLQQEAQPRLTRTSIFRDREDAERRLRADYFDDNSGANNDINVLDNSPLSDDLLEDLAPVVSYVVNGVEYRNGYYLADGIYP
nr:protein ALP1-like [Tanacetum cinerariifolium]